MLCAVEAGLKMLSRLDSWKGSKKMTFNQLNVRFCMCFQRILYENAIKGRDSWLDSSSWEKALIADLVSHQNNVAAENTSASW